MSNIFFWRCKKKKKAMQQAQRLVTIMACILPAAAYNGLGCAPHIMKASQSGVRGLECIQNRKRGSKGTLLTFQNDKASGVWRRESVLRPGQCDAQSTLQEPNDDRGRRLRPAARASGTLKITRGDIEGSLACADKNLARFRKRLTFADCELAFLDPCDNGTSEICAEISVQRMTGAEFFLAAELSGSVTSECDRCLCRFERDWSASFSLVLASRKQLTDHARRRADEVDDPNVLKFSEKVDESIVDFSPGIKFLDIKDDVADAVAGAIPRKALCSVECRGRCRACGEPLSQTKLCICRATSNDAGAGGGDGDRGEATSTEDRAGLQALVGGGAGGSGRGVGGGLNSEKMQALLRLKSDLEMREHDSANGAAN